MLSKYQPLAEYLVARTDLGTLVLTFDEIGVILGAPLPDTMRVETQAWNGDHHSYVRAWQAVGWRAALDRRNRCVIFTRAVTESGA